MANVDDLATIVDSQQTKIISLEDASKNAKMIMAIIGLGSALLAAIVTAGSFYIRFNDELRNWEDIKIAHERKDGNRISYDHKTLSQEQLNALREQLALPDFNKFTKTDDLPDFNTFAKSKELPNFNNYVLSNDLPIFSQYAKVNQVADLIDLSQYATTEYVKRYVEVNSNSVHVLKAHKASTGSVFQDTVELDKPGLLLFQAHGKGDRSGKLTNAGIVVTTLVNGKTCGRDMSFEGETVTVQFFSNVTCVRQLPAGKHSLEASRRDISITGGRELNVEYYILSIN